MSPDDSSLPAQAGFTRTFSIASLLHFLSSFCDVPCLSASPPLPLPFVSYLHYLLAVLQCHSGGTYGTSKQRAGGVEPTAIGVVVLGGYVCSSRTFSWWRVGTCGESSWLRLWKSVLRHGDVLAEGFLVFIFVAFRCHFLGRTFLTSSSHSEFKMLFLVQGHFLEYITSLNVV